MKHFAPILQFSSVSVITSNHSIRPFIDAPSHNETQRSHPNVSAYYSDGMRETDDYNPKRLFFRSGDRFACHDGKWWFSERGGEQGPFESRESAELALKRLIDGADLLDKMQEDQASLAPEPKLEPKLELEQEPELELEPRRLSIDRS